MAVILLKLLSEKGSSSVSGCSPSDMVGYFLFSQMKVNLIFLETSGFTQ